MASLDLSSRRGARFLPGELIGGRYRIRKLIGTGGECEAYAATDGHGEEPVVLRMSSNRSRQAAAVAAKFQCEIEIANRIHHPAVARIYGVIQHTPGSEGAGEAVVAQVGEWVPGPTLAELLSLRGPRSPGQAGEIAMQVVDGLAAIHAAGVLHLDVKSANVVIAGAERRKPRSVWIDFGAAVLLDGRAIEPRTSRRGGTALYAAPERLAGEPATAAADVYSLGVVLTELFLGRPSAEVRRPSGESAAAWVRRTALRQRLPKKRLELVLRCLEPDPGRRFASALEVAQALADERKAILAVPALRRPASSRRSGNGEAEGAFTAGLRFARDLDLLAARRCFERAVEAKPDSAIYRLELAEALAASGLEQRAEAEASAALASVPSLRPLESVAFGALVERLSGHPMVALRGYWTVFDNAEGTARHGLRLADLLIDLGRAEEAHAVLEEQRHRLASEPRPDLEIAAARAAGARSDFRAQRRLAAGVARSAEARRSPGLVAAALVQLGSAAEGSGRPRAAERWFRAAARRYGRLGDRRNEARCVSRQAFAARNHKPLSELLALIQRARELAESVGDRRLRARIWNREGALYFLAGRLQWCKRRFVAALVLAGETGDLQCQAESWRNLAHVTYRRGDPPAALRFLKAAREISRAIGDLRGQGRAEFGIASVECFAEDPLGSWASIERALAFCAARGDRVGVALVLCNQAVVQSAAGRPGAALAAVRRAEALGGLAPTVISAAQASILGALGRVREALESSVENLARCDRLGRGSELFLLTGCAAEAMVGVGEPERALALTEQVWRLAVATAPVDALMGLATARIRACLALGDLRAADRCVADMRRYRELRDGYWDSLTLRTAEAEVLAASGRTGEALAELRAVEERAAAIGLHEVRLTARLARARCQLGGGWLTLANRLAESVAQQAAVRGLCLLEQQAREVELCSKRTTLGRGCSMIEHRADRLPMLRRVVKVLTGLRLPFTLEFWECVASRVKSLVPWEVQR